MENFTNNKYYIASKLVSHYTPSVKRYYLVIILIASCIVGIFLIFGFLAGLKKSLGVHPKADEGTSQRLRQKQQSIIDETEEKRRLYMENYRDRMRDRNYRF